MRSIQYDERGQVQILIIGSYINDAMTILEDIGENSEAGLLLTMLWNVSSAFCLVGRNFQDSFIVAITMD